MTLICVHTHAAKPTRKSEIKCHSVTEKPPELVSTGKAVRVDLNTASGSADKITRQKRISLSRTHCRNVRLFWSSN